MVLGVRLFLNRRTGVYVRLWRIRVWMARFGWLSRLVLMCFGRLFMFRVLLMLMLLMCRFRLRLMSMVLLMVRLMRLGLLRSLVLLCRRGVLRLSVRRMLILGGLLLLRRCLRFIRWCALRWLLRMLLVRVGLRWRLDRWCMECLRWWRSRRLRVRMLSRRV